LLDETESRYVAVEGDRIYRQRLNYMPIIHQAYRKKVRLHGFGCVKKRMLDRYPFYSVDSTSWKAGVQYGNLTAWQDDTLRQLPLKREGGHDEVNKRAIPRILQVSASGEPVYGCLDSGPSSRNSRLKAAIIAYRKMEEYYTQLWKARGIDWDAIVE